MKLFRGSREFLEYLMFFAALLPTLLVLLAAGLSLIDERTAIAVTTPIVPIYRAN